MKVITFSVAVVVLFMKRSPRRHRSSSLSPQRQKDRRDDDKKEGKEKAVKVHQISGDPLFFIVKSRSFVSIVIIILSLCVIFLMLFLVFPSLCTAEDMQGKTEEEIEMMKLMGFGSFDSTKVSG